MRTTLVMNADSRHNVRGGEGRVSSPSKDSRPLLLLLLKIDFVGICSVNMRFVTDEVGVPERGGKWITKGRWAVGIRLQLQSLTGQKLVDVHPHNPDPEGQPSHGVRPSSSPSQTVERRLAIGLAQLSSPT